MSLKNALPQSLVANDCELKKLAETLDKGLESFKSKNNLDESVFDILRMDIQIVEKWLKTFGYKQNWQVDKKRLLKALLTLYRLGGTAEGIIKAIKEFIGIEVVSIYEAWPEAYKKGQILTDDQKRQVTVYLSNYPYGEQTLNFLPFAQMICDYLKPVHVKLTVEIKRHINADFPMPISNLAGKTIRYITYMSL